MAPPTAPGEGGPASPLAGLGLKYQNLLAPAALLAVCWFIAVDSRSTVALVVLGVLTAALVVGALLLFRWIKRQQAMAALVQRGAKDPVARREGIEQLKAREGDPLATLMRAQLEAQDDPEKARATLASIDLQRVPAALAGEVRSMRAQMALVQGELEEARALAEGLELKSLAQPESRALAASVLAEVKARSGDPEGARDLLGLFPLDAKEFAPMAPTLRFAWVFTAYALGDEARVRSELRALAALDINLLGRFVAPQCRVDPALGGLVHELIATDPALRRLVMDAEAKRRSGAR